MDQRLRNINDLLEQIGDSSSISDKSKSSSSDEPNERRSGSVNFNLKQTFKQGKEAPTVQNVSKFQRYGSSTQDASMQALAARGNQSRRVPSGINFKMEVPRLSLQDLSKLMKEEEAERPVAEEDDRIARVDCADRAMHGFAHHHQRTSEHTASLKSVDDDDHLIENNENEQDTVQDDREKVDFTRKDFPPKTRLLNPLNQKSGMMEYFQMVFGGGMAYAEYYNLVRRNCTDISTSSLVHQASASQSLLQRQRSSFGGAIRAKFGKKEESCVSQYLQIWKILHGALVNEFKDLAILKNALENKHHNSKLGVIRMEATLFIQWWRLFESFCLQYFHTEDQCLLGYTPFTFFASILQGKRELVKQFLYVIDIIHEFETDGDKNTIKLSTALSDLIKKFVEYLELEYGVQISTEFPKVLDTRGLQQRVLNYFVEGPYPEENLVLLIKAMRDKKERGRWLRENVNFKTRQEVRGWEMRVYESHTMVVQHLQATSGMQK